MKLVISLCSILAVSQAVGFYEIVKEEWEVFKMQHKKQYSPMEEKFRMKVFAENKHKIAKHNARHLRGEVNYKLGMNEFGDMLHHEFVQKMNGYRHSMKAAKKIENRPATFITPANVRFPENVDWREDGAVTPVKNQGQCGSCWSFSATGALEGQHFRKTGILVSLSEQNLIDCSGKYGNEGCNGGLMDQAFQYVRDNRGIDTEVSYPYEAEDDKCRYNSRNSGATDVGYVDIPEGSEKRLREAVATVGPISVAIDASHESFQFYQGGIYYDPQCNSTALDHGVLVIGYGAEESQDYWLVKNSWGSTWGDNGFVKIARNRENHCGIATTASYPLV